jgi:eukaryotic-like serine/threonine-protein kinase
MDSRQVIARFEAERQALAMMDHVNIARVLDAGTTPDGLPYFVMELVHGVPITQYCDDNHLTPRERLELFVPVCQAIQHAHQKGIIHRDVKPSNVMITLYDGKPVPKVIDFGVAKATEQRLTERTLFTQFGTMVGTLEYMSPEQAEMSALGVDTRSDIYSLGVLLYELLTGNTPLSHKRVKEAAYAEILRIIKEEEPPKPSTRLSESGEALASISAQRHMEPAKLSKLMRGELDWIVMKTLEKDRNRRYPTANAFAADLERYLRDEPIAACPPSISYRLRKFARRHRIGVLAGAAVTLALALGFIMAIVGFVTARHEAARADREAINAETGLARMLQAQGRFAEAERLYRQSLARRRRLLGSEDLEVSESLRNLGALLTAQGKHSDAEPLYREALAMREKLLGHEHLDVAASKQDLAGLLEAQWRFSEAEQYYRDVLALQRKSLGSQRPEVANSVHNLAWVLQSRGKLSEAEPLYREALAMQRKLLGIEHPDFARTLSSLGSLLQAQGKLSEAEPLCRQVLALRRILHDNDGLDVATSIRNLASLTQAQGKFSEAEPLYRESLAMRQRLLGDEHPDVAASLRELAMFLQSQGRLGEAESLMRKNVDVCERVFPLGDWSIAVANSILGATLSRQGKYEEAERLLLNAYHQLQAHPPPPPQAEQLGDALNRIVELYDAWGKSEKASEWRSMLQLPAPVPGTTPGDERSGQ